MQNPLANEATLEAMAGLLESTMMTDKCVIYHKISGGPAGVGASDGRGGFGDNRGGSKTTFDAGTETSCRMDSFWGGTEVLSDNIQRSSVPQVLYVPRKTVVGIQDEVETAAGDPEGISHRYQITGTLKETEGLDIGLTLKLVR